MALISQDYDSLVCNVNWHSVNNKS